MNGEVSRAPGVSGVGCVDRDKTFDCHQLRLQYQHMYWRYIVEIFNVVFFQVLDSFED